MRRTSVDDPFMEVKIFFSFSLSFFSCFQLRRKEVSHGFSYLSTGKIKFEERPTLRSRSVTFDWLYRKSAWNFVFFSSLNCCRVFGEAVAFSFGLSINALLYGLTSWGFADKRRETRLSRITDGLFTLREYSWKFPFKFYFLFSQERIFMK